jgi:hypothetical protein
MWVSRKESPVPDPHFGEARMAAAMNLPSRFLSDLPPELVEGLSPRASIEAEIRNLREQSTWHPQREERPTSAPKTPARSKIREQIVPFPGTSAETTSRFNATDRVVHKQFGTGVVLDKESKRCRGGHGSVRGNPSSSRRRWRYMERIED